MPRQQSLEAPQGVAQPGGGRAAKGRGKAGGSGKGGRQKKEEQQDAEEAEGEPQEGFSVLLPRPPAPTTAVLPCSPEEAVGRTVLVWYVDDANEQDGSGTFYEGSITSYKPKSGKHGKHGIDFPDEDETQWFDLTGKEYVVWSGRDPAAPGAVITGPGARWPGQAAAAGEAAAGGEAAAAGAGGEPSPTGPAPVKLRRAGSSGQHSLARSGSGEAQGGRRPARGRKGAAAGLLGDEPAESPRTAARRGRQRRQAEDAGAGGWRARGAACRRVRVRSLSQGGQSMLRSGRGRHAAVGGPENLLENI